MRGCAWRVRSGRALLVLLLAACSSARPDVPCEALDRLRISRGGVDVTVRAVADDAGVVHVLVHTEAHGMVGIKNHMRLVMTRADGGVALRSEATDSEDIPDAGSAVYAPLHLETVTHEAVDDDVTITR